MLTNPVITKINEQQMLTNRPAFRVGDTIAVVIRVIEGGKERPQTFQGVVLAINKRGLHSSFIVRKISHGIGVERTFMLHSRAIQEIRVVRTGQVRQARIYYMRQRSGKSARIAERFDAKPGAAGGAKTATKPEPELEPEEVLSAPEQAEAALAAEMNLDTPTETSEQAENTEAETGEQPEASREEAAAATTNPAAETAATEVLETPVAPDMETPTEEALAETVVADVDEADTTNTNNPETEPKS